jgi:hypothetical protein
MGANFHLSLWNNLPWEVGTRRLVSSEERLRLGLQIERLRNLFWGCQNKRKLEMENERYMCALWTVWQWPCMPMCNFVLEKQLLDAVI